MHGGGDRGRGRAGARQTGTSGRRQAGRFVRPGEPVPAEPQLFRGLVEDVRTVDNPRGEATRAHQVLRETHLRQQRGQEAVRDPFPRLHLLRQRVRETDRLQQSRIGVPAMPSHPDALGPERGSYRLVEDLGIVHITFSEFHVYVQFEGF